MAAIPRNERELLVGLHASLAVRFGTSAPFTIGAIRGVKVGFAQDPCVVCDVVCRDGDLSSLVPIVRQHVYRELSGRGWDVREDAELVAFTPSTQRGRRRRFVDANESSETFGRNRMGMSYEFRFLMSHALAAATFVGFGSFKTIPNRWEVSS